MTPEERASKLQCYGGGGGITFVSKVEAADAIRAAVQAEREAILEYCDALIDEAGRSGDDRGETVAMIIKAAIRARTAQDEGE